MNFHNHHHEAVDNLLKLFTIVNHYLNLVENRLLNEFEYIYPENSAPVLLIEKLPYFRVFHFQHFFPLDMCCYRLYTNLRSVYTVIIRLEKKNISLQGDEEADSVSEDINQKLFSAIVQGN
ncbi:hypothetical protein DCAR_0104968 [Daucus carota subsp. sativus]|uniref:Ska2 N-terminal domain-containing protein n=1 Tax=Daucus carota subsp. sativus TaxID=79200 RepID=A0AAF0W9H4_DAUCS|nr:hypothetical protein DCAR_0104968 [Daucus carota subsp. sativus]